MVGAADCRAAAAEKDRDRVRVLVSAVRGTAPSCCCFAARAREVVRWSLEAGWTRSDLEAAVRRLRLTADIFLRRSSHRLLGRLRRERSVRMETVLERTRDDRSRGCARNTVSSSTERIRPHVSATRRAQVCSAAKVKPTGPKLSYPKVRPPRNRSTNPLLPRDPPPRGTLFLSPSGRNPPPPPLTVESTLALGLRRSQRIVLPVLRTSPTALGSEAPSRPSASACPDPRHYSWSCTSPGQ